VADFCSFVLKTMPLSLSFRVFFLCVVRLSHSACAFYPPLPRCDFFFVSSVVLGLLCVFSPSQGVFISPLNSCVFFFAVVRSKKKIKQEEKKVEVKKKQNHHSKKKRTSIQKQNKTEKTQNQSIKHAGKQQYGTSGFLLPPIIMCFFSPAARER